MADTAVLIAIVAAIFALGVIAQLLSERFKLPSIVFLILAGVVLGPEGFGLVTRETFGAGLPTIVGIAVAIIVFEGAYHLRTEDLLATQRTRLQLVTVGALIALVGTTVLVWYALGTTLDLAILIGALLVATGPTVIEPIMKVVPVRDQVQNTLSYEGVVNDVTAAILAVGAFKLVMAPGPMGVAFIGDFLRRFGLGILTGIVVALAARLLIRFAHRSPGDAVRNVRVLVLAAALVSYAGADFLAEEAGIAATATAGLVLGNSNLPYDETIGEFKGDITQVVLSFVFIILAALLEFDDIAALGVGGLLVVAGVMFVIRPLVVFVSTSRRQFTVGEQVFMSFVAPRGIIPASVATLFAVELTHAGRPAEATTLVGAVFLVILTTVVIEGGFAGILAQVLDVIPKRILIIGGGKVGRGLARRLEDRGENVVLVEHDDDALEKARREGHKVYVGDGTDTDDLRAAGIKNAKYAIVATDDDDTNLLATQLASKTFEVDQIIARVNDPENLDAFEDLDVRAISPTLATIWSIDNFVERPALSQWMLELTRSGDVQEIEVTSEELVGKSVAEVRRHLPDGCMLALVSRDGEPNLPKEDFELKRGDTITVLGETDAVREALDQYESFD